MDKMLDAGFLMPSLKKRSYAYFIHHRASSIRWLNYKDSLFASGPSALLLLAKGRPCPVRFYALFLNLMLNRFIWFQTLVLDMPRIRAASDWLPPDCRSASMSRRFFISSRPNDDGSPVSWGISMCKILGGRCSGPIIDLWQATKAYSRVLLSSLTFPGHGYIIIRSKASLAMP
jgi:hypothetical protein